MEAGLLFQFCNWSTLVVCMVIKFPQIFALLSTKSSRGVSLKSLLLELVGFLVFLRYQSYYGYPLLTYLENPILIAQDVVLLLCVFHYNGSMKQAIPYFVVFLGGWYLLTLQKWIIDLAMVLADHPCELLSPIRQSSPKTLCWPTFFLNLCTFISAASKFAQLQYLWEAKDSGAVSALTWSLSAYTCATRVITTLMTTQDLMVLVRFLTMLALNIWVTATVLRYRKTPGKDE